MDQLLSAGTRAWIDQIIERNGDIFAISLLGGINQLKAIHGAFSLGRTMAIDRTGNPAAKFTSGEYVRPYWRGKGWMRVGPRVVNQEEYPGLYQIGIFHRYALGKTEPEERIHDDHVPITSFAMPHPKRNPLDLWFDIINERYHRVPLLPEWKSALYTYLQARDKGHIINIGAGGIITTISQQELRDSIIHMSSRGTIKAPKGVANE